MKKTLGAKLGDFFGLRTKREPPDNLGKTRVNCIICKKNYKLRYPEYADLEKTWWKCKECIREQNLRIRKEMLDKSGR